MVVGRGGKVKEGSKQEYSGCGVNSEYYFTLLFLSVLAFSMAAFHCYGTNSPSAF